MKPRCKYCPRYELKLRHVEGNLYFGSCTNPNHSYGVYLRLGYVPRWGRANI